MDFGILCPASVDSWKDVALAETSGFTHAWIADSQMVWADPTSAWPSARQTPGRSGLALT